MKLCRFELLASPGTVKSGIVYSGKIYETDGANPIAVHEAADVRPLPPVGTPQTIRIFRLPLRTGERVSNDDLETLPYVYGNPGTIVGASQIVTVPDYVTDLQYEPYLAGVVASPAQRIQVEAADDILLGISIMNLFVSRNTIRRSETAHAYDFVSALGPVLTTPDDLESHITDHEFGNRYKLNVVTRRNGVDQRRGDTIDLPLTLAQAFSYCSEAVQLQPGDIFAIGPIAPWTDDEPALEPGDEIQIAVENLGTLSTKISTEGPEA